MVQQMWHRRTGVTPGRAAAVAALMLSLVLAGCAPRTEPPPPAPREVDVVAVAPEEPVARNIPYEGALPPGDPPQPPMSPMQKPLEPWVKAALDVWYERPSPKGPEPIPLAQPKAIYFSGTNPVIQVLPGPAAFPEKIPERLKVVMPEKIPFSNNVKRLPRGSIRVVAFDNTLNDTKLSQDSMEVEISFVDHEGAEWRIEQVMLAPISDNPVFEPWFGGLVIDTLYHGHTGNGTPAEPLVRCMHCSWGWADVYKNGKRVASSANLHIMLTSDVRDDSKNFAYACYECANNPVRAVHVIVHPSAYLPSPGGFLHVMWENAEWTRGSPQEIARKAPKIGEDLPTIELSAVPHLRWDKQEIRVKAGQKYRLIVHNNDPISFHQFHLHSHPAGGGHHGGQQDARHEEGMTAGRIGGLWKPGDEGHGQGDPPAPRNVFFPLPQGSTWATTVMFEKPGEYEFMCPVTNHYRRGMHGKFIVSAGGAEAPGLSTGGAGEPGTPPVQPQRESMRVRKGGAQ